jgi:glycosyltransferase XagB
MARTRIPLSGLFRNTPTTPAKLSDIRRSTRDAILTRGGAARQPLRTGRDALQGEDYTFLCKRNIDIATLERAIDLAHDSGVGVHDVLIALGWVSETDYVAALARHLGLNVARADDILSPSSAPDKAALPWTVQLRGHPPRIGVRAVAVLPSLLKDQLARDPTARDRIALVTTADVEAALLSRHRPDVLRKAMRGLDVKHPDFSARSGSVLWQRLAAATFIGMMIGGLAVAPDIALNMLSLALAVPFFCVVLLRSLSAIELLRKPHEDPSAHPTRSGTRMLGDAALPIYTILVPLHAEAEVLPRLVKCLLTLDYPTPKLDILLVLESSDTQTRAAADALDLPGCIRVILVPPGGPQTKPKALNYALQLARGDLVVVYDAEDRPEPDQLRIAATRFAQSGPDLACLQARLNVYNPHENIITRQFTLEYSVLFDATLPALERLGLPLPLGGTSNHFPMATLRAVGGWDPYNVTEDADLGIRLARLGMRTATIDSTTWEEAPTDFGNWWRQRTRWLKGWMQTWIVHMRQPMALWRDLGTFKMLGLQVLMGGMLMSVIAYPLFWAVVIAELSLGDILQPRGAEFSRWIWLISGFNLALGFTVGILAALQRDRRWLVPWTFLMPFYWLAISAAGYRAMWQLIRKPFLWEKTQHGVRFARNSKRRP